jgi:hypothetical protein
VTRQRTGLLVMRVGLRLGPLFCARTRIPWSAFYWRVQARLFVPARKGISMKPILIAIIGVGALACSTPISADAWKDESGKYSRGDRDRGHWRESRRHARIPHGHLPPPGECRVWYRDVPPGHQPPPEEC